MGPPFGKRGGGAGGGGSGFGGSRVTTFKIFLSGLPDGFKNSDLEPMFEAFGRTIECEVFRNNFAFVHMEEEECGREAIKALNATEVNGKKISVVESKNTEGPNIQKMKLSVKNIPKTVNANEIRSMFKKYGRVLEAEVLANGNGSVTLEATGDIRTAINEMNGYLLGTQQLIVEAVKVNPKQAASQAAFGGSGGFSGGGMGEGGRGMGGMRGGRGMMRGGPAGYGRGRGAAPASFGGGYYEDDYYGPPAMGMGRGGGPAYPLGQREYYETAQKPPLLRPPQRRPMYQTEYYEDDDYYTAGAAPVARPSQYGRPQPPQSGYEEDESYSYDDSGYYTTGQVSGQDYSQLSDRFGGYQQPPPRKVAKGEPYPPPAPNSVPRTPRADMYAAQAQFAGGPAPAVGAERPKGRGERGGRNRLTAGKIALLEAMKSAGINVPKGHIPSLLDVRATFGPRGGQPGGPGPRARFPTGPGGGPSAAAQMPSPNMMPIASRYTGPPRPRQPASAAVKNLQQMALGGNAMSTSYPLPLFPSSSGVNRQSVGGGQSSVGYQEDLSAGYAGGTEETAQQEYYSGYGESAMDEAASGQGQRNPDIDFTADIMLF